MVEGQEMIKIKNILMSFFKLNRLRNTPLNFDEVNNSKNVINN